MPPPLRSLCASQRRRDDAGATGKIVTSAPVATRIRTYSLPVSDLLNAYVEAIYSLPAFQQWLALALREPWIVDDDEIDVIQGRVKPGTLA